MNPKNNNGATALVKAFETAGITKIFTLSGNHIMPVYNALFDSKIDLIHTRHEGAAVHMADAWARLTGEVGIALVTGGPGHANAVSALYTASMAESPVVLLSGHAPLAQLGKGAFQEMRQTDIAAPLTKASWACQKTEDIGLDIAKAIRIAKSGRPGPVHLSLPTDISETALPQSTPMPTVSYFDAEPVQPQNSDISSILEKLRQASKPLVLAGPQMLSQIGKTLLSQLESALGVPVIGMESPRGIADPSLGAFSEILSQSDCVLLLGKKIDFTLKFAQSPGFNTSCLFLQIDPETEEIQRAKNALGQRLVQSTISDIPSAIKTILRLNSSSSITQSDWQKEVAAAIAFQPPSWSTLASSKGKLHPVHALAPLQEILDSHPDSVLISDGGDMGQWAQACLRAPNRVINGVAGSIGAGLPFATAASIAKSNTPIIAVMGDGTFGFHSAEIDTAVRYQLPFVLIVGNDAKWNAEYQIQVRDYGQDRTIGCEFFPLAMKKFVRLLVGMESMSMT
jgi:acetolactate synthase-1/2/3 large subunit